MKSIKVKKEVLKIDAQKLFSKDLMSIRGGARIVPTDGADIFTSTGTDDADCWKCRNTCQEHN